MALTSELTGFARFLLGLPAFLRERITLEEAQGVLQQRMHSREANLLTTLERGVFAQPNGLYARLLRTARCEPGDIRTLLARDGVEATLRTLHDAGVRVDFDAFKGRAPLVRDGQEIAVRAEDFDNPGFTRHYAVSTGGSTGTGRRVLMDLEYMHSRLPMQIVADHVFGLRGVPTALWFEIPPGNGLGSVLLRVPYDNVPARWFTPVWDDAPLRFRLATRAALAVSRASGARVPRPELVRLGEAERIARWAEETLRRHGHCAVRGHVSKMLRVAVAARERGIDLEGATLTGGGEPPTPGKVRQIESTGARFIANYHLMEAGPIGKRCLASDDPNDQHLLEDHVALIQTSRTLAGFDVRVDPFCFTTLLPSAPKLMLNVEIDDYGVVETRSCGCPWEAYGFTTHVRDIRSYRKLTGEGVTFVGADMERILEEILPARFGGSPLDYQFVEEEDERGFTRLGVVVHPDVALADERAVADVVLESLRRAEGAEILVALWRQADSLHVIREAPRFTGRGKLIPLRVRKPAPEGDA